MRGGLCDCEFILLILGKLRDFRRYMLGYFYLFELFLYFSNEMPYFSKIY